jgi:hypothetical protein
MPVGVFVSVGELSWKTAALGLFSENIVVVVELIESVLHSKPMQESENESTFSSNVHSIPNLVTERKSVDRTRLRSIPSTTCNERDA